MPQISSPTSTPASTPIPRLDARDATRICGLFFAARLLVLAVSALSHLVVIQGPYPRYAHTWVERFLLWDTGWYLNIADFGYFYRPDAQSSVAFYPLLPMLLRGVRHLGIDPVLAGYAFSHAALLGACFFLWKIAALETRSKRVADLAVTFLLFCPGAVWFGMIYTESFFLVTQLGCLLCARQGRWIVAGLWGMLSALTRTPGLLLAGFLFLEGLQQWHERRSLRHAFVVATSADGPAAPTASSDGAPRENSSTLGWFVRVALGIAGPVLGQAGYLTFLQLCFGDWRAQQKTVIAGWNGGQGFSPPWTALVHQWQTVDLYIMGLAIPLMIIVVGMALLSFFSLKRLSYGALMLALCALYTTTAGHGLARYLCTVAPAFLVLAQLADRSSLLERVALAFSVAMMSLTTILLINGYLLV